MNSQRTVLFIFYHSSSYAFMICVAFFKLYFLSHWQKFDILLYCFLLENLGKKNVVTSLVLTPTSSLPGVLGGWTSIFFFSFFKFFFKTKTLVHTHWACLLCSFQNQCIVSKSFGPCTHVLRPHWTTEFQNLLKICPSSTGALPCGVFLTFV